MQDLIDYTQHHADIAWNNPQWLEGIQNCGHHEWQWYITNYNYPAHGKIHGYFTLLHNTVGRLAPDAVIVELGNREGLSTLAICDALQLHQTFYTMDIDEDLRFVPAHVRHDKRVHVLHGDCLLPHMINQIPDGSVDLLFSDTIHCYDQIHKEFAAYECKLKDTACVMVDDIKTHDKGRFYDEWMHGAKYNTDAWCHGAGGFGVFEYTRTR